jgi:S1-C subfamily serine protease
MRPLRGVFAGLALLLAGIAGPAHAQPSQANDGALIDWMRGKLVFLQAKAETPAGVEISTEGTGFFINRQGNILTSYHLIDKLGRFNPSSLSITARIASKNAPPITAEIVDANNIRDVMVLDIENYAAPEPVCVNDHFVMLGRLKTPILTAGFPHYLPFYGVSGDIVGEGPNGTWAVDLVFNEGQSGSPVFDRNGFVIGIAKGQMENDLGVAVPGVYIVVPVPRNGNTSTAYDLTDAELCPYRTEGAAGNSRSTPPAGATLIWKPTRLP